MLLPFPEAGGNALKDCFLFHPGKLVMYLGCLASHLPVRETVQ